MYVHGSAGENSFIRDLALDLAIEHDLDIEINPGFMYPSDFASALEVASLEDIRSGI